MSDDGLDRLCELCGIALDYHDIWGSRRQVPEASRRALLAAMGVRIDGDRSPEAAIREIEQRPWRRALPPVLVWRDSRSPIRIPLTVAAARLEQPLAWTFTPEQGEPFRGILSPHRLPQLAERVIDGERQVRCIFELPHLPGIGYHGFAVGDDSQAGTAAESMRLIVAPSTCYQPEILAGAGRTWGPAVQLYAVRSARNWGIGDFGDLRRLVEFAAQAGADAVGLNPLHALFPDQPAHASPYSPSNRMWLNVLYLDVESMADFAECPAASGKMSDPSFQARLQALREQDWVDYPAVAAVKMEVFDLLWRHFRGRHLGRATELGRQFGEYQREGGRGLRLHGLFEALMEHFRRDDPAGFGWGAWPQAYRNPQSPAVRAFEEEHAERVEFFEYLQWQAELQLASAERRAAELGMGVGLYQDLALGADRGGAETWIEQPVFALPASAGAPPDDFNPLGQNWGLPPMIPHRLQEAGYRPFIDVLRAGMRHAGALRIDHVMGLMRLFWVPPDGSAAQGAYVRYPFDDLLGILALESHRNRCLVVGEDLGTVPDEVRAALAPMGVLSYRLLLFQKDWEGSFLPPANYPAQALVSVTTHDLPTLRGFWQGRDLQLRHTLELFPSESFRQAQMEARSQDRARLLAALEREGLLPGGAGLDPADYPEMTWELVRAIHLFLARAPAKLMVVQMEDVLEQSEPVNLPGTTEQWPNWRRKLSIELERWTADGRIADIAEALRDVRGYAR